MASGLNKGRPSLPQPVKKGVQVPKPATSATPNQPPKVPEKPKDELAAFGLLVLEKMESEKIPPLPLNYQVYFETLLDDQPDAFKKLVASNVSLDNDDIAERGREIEKSFRQSLAHTKELLQTVATVYKQATVAGEKAKSKIEAVKGLAHATQALEMTQQLLAEWESFVNVFKAEALKMNDLYASNVKLFRQTEKESIFDPQFGIFNQRHFLKQCTNEAARVSRFGHSSCVLALSLRHEKIDEIGNERKLLLVNKTMAKLLVKTSRRSDIIGYLGNGVFGIILRNTDTASAVKTAERISSMLLDSNFYLGEHEFVIHTAIGIAPLGANALAEEMLTQALAALRESDNASDHKSVVYQTAKRAR